MTDRDNEPRPRQRELWEQPSLAIYHARMAEMNGGIPEYTSNIHREAQLTSQPGQSRNKSIKSEPSSKHSGIVDRRVQTAPRAEQVRKPLVINYHPRPVPISESARKRSASVNSRGRQTSINHSSHTTPMPERPIPLPDMPR